LKPARLTRAEIVTLSGVLSDSGIKTVSTGTDFWPDSRVDADDIKAIREALDAKIAIKAVGNIRDAAAAQALLDADWDDAPRIVGQSGRSASATQMWLEVAHLLPVLNRNLDLFLNLIWRGLRLRKRLGVRGEASRGSSNHTPPPALTCSPTRGTLRHDESRPFAT
jgi:hypothetical protein